MIVAIVVLLVVAVGIFLYKHGQNSAAVAKADVAKDAPVVKSDASKVVADVKADVAKVETEVKKVV